MNFNSKSYGAERLSLFWFFVLLFICTVGVVPMILASHGRTVSTPLKLLQLLMLFGPGLVAIVASYVNHGSAGVKDLLRGLIHWKVHPGWYLLTILGPPATHALALVVSNQLGFTSRALPDWATIASTFVTSFGVYLLLNTEELAWRGYALPRLQARNGIIVATIIIGILWAVIHFPLFLLKGGHPAGYSFAGFLIRLFFFNFLFTAVYFGSGRSILLAHFLHQSVNASVEAIPVYPRAINSSAPMNIAAAVLFVIAALLLVRLLRGNHRFAWKAD